MIVNKNLIKEDREKYFKLIQTLTPQINSNIVVLTHILPDRLELIQAINNVCHIVKIIAIPYSIDHDMLEVLSKDYDVATPSLSELSDNDFLLTLMSDIDRDQNLILMEIGGYFANIVHSLKELFGNSFLGVIESTEAGHRQYVKLPSLPCPVVSIARGTLKFTEYGLIGRSCVFSADKIAREAGILLDGKDVLVLGYGRVGMGVAHALRGRDCIVYVYDTNPIRRALAISNGFRTGVKQSLLAKSDFIFGTSGNFSIQSEDYFHLKKGAILISCSSKDIEFELTTLISNFENSPISTHLDRYSTDNHYFYLAAKGFPANFIDNAIVGPILALIQAEILIATKTLFELAGTYGLFEVPECDRMVLAEKWLDCFAKP